MAVEMFPGNDDHYEDIDFGDPPQDEEMITQMWRGIAESVCDLEIDS